MTYDGSVMTNWSVSFSNKAAKQYRKIPETIRDAMDALALEIQVSGPVRGNWKNYSKLGATTHHCHLKSGHPTYVACWEVLSKDKTVRLVEVYYVGTHEKAPY